MKKEEIAKTGTTQSDGEVVYMDVDRGEELAVTIGYHGRGVHVSVPNDLEEHERKEAMEFIAEWLTVAAGGPDGDSHEWPQFSFGKVFMIGGRPFSVLRINLSSIVMRPLPTRGYGSPRKLIEMMT